jgi:heavy metal sensor kinase
MQRSEMGIYTDELSFTVRKTRRAAERDSSSSSAMTIRLRLTLWYTALLGTTLILFSVVVYSALATNLWAQVEQDAARQAGEVATALTQQLQFDILVIRNTQSQVQFPDVDFFASASGVQVIGFDGMIYKRSSNLGSMRVPDYMSALDPIRSGENHSYYTTGVNDTRMLVYSVPLMVNESIVGAVQVVKTVDAVSNALSQISRYLILGTALSLVLAAIVGAFLARRTLAPLDAITRTAGSITQTGDLGRRLNVLEDQSEVGQLSATFNAMLDQIQQLFNTQQQLIADVSHELRTPLTTVQGNVQLLQRMVETAQAGKPITPEMLGLLPEILGEVEIEATRMNAMINDLLLLAQADSGALALQQEPVEMDTLLLEIYRQAQRLADQTRGPDMLDIRLGSEDQAMILGDRERLRQLLLNLLDNAIKYTPEGGAITLALEVEDDWVKVMVTDTGIGISPENQELIFSRFYRTDKARTRELGGSGLGLSIVQWIAEAHGGRVTVESELGEGSTFTLHLPTYTPESSAKTAAD